MTISSKTAIGRRELRKGEKDKYQGKKRKEDYKRGRTRGGNLYQGLNHLALCLLKHPPSTCRVILFLRAPQDASPLLCTLYSPIIPQRRHRSYLHIHPSSPLPAWVSTAHLLSQSLPSWHLSHSESSPTPVDDALVSILQKLFARPC